MFDINQIVVTKDKPTGITIANNPKFREFLRDNALGTYNFRTLHKLMSCCGQSFEIVDSEEWAGRTVVKFKFYIVHLPTGDYIEGYYKMPEDQLYHLTDVMGKRAKIHDRLLAVAKQVYQKGYNNIADQLIRLAQEEPVEYDDTPFEPMSITIKIEKTGTGRMRFKATAEGYSAMGFGSNPKLAIDSLVKQIWLTTSFGW